VTDVFRDLVQLRCRSDYAGIRERSDVASLAVQPPLGRLEEKDQSVLDRDGGVPVHSFRWSPWHAVEVCALANTAIQKSTGRGGGRNFDALRTRDYQRGGLQSVPLGRTAIVPWLLPSLDQLGSNQVTRRESRRTGVLEDDGRCGRPDSSAVKGHDSGMDCHCRPDNGGCRSAVIGRSRRAQSFCRSSPRLCPSEQTSGEQRAILDKGSGGSCAALLLQRMTDRFPRSDRRHTTMRPAQTGNCAGQQQVNKR